MRVLNTDPEGVAALAMIHKMYRCEFCAHEGQIHAHHIYARGMGNGSCLTIPINLIALCNLCHRRMEDGNLRHPYDRRLVTRRDLWGLAAEREIYRMLREPNP